MPRDDRPGKDRPRAFARDRGAGDPRGAAGGYAAAPKVVVRKAAPRPRLSKEAAAQILAAERQVVVDRFDVSRETLARLDGYAALLGRWQAAVNLVSPASLPHLWSRHIGDALALARLAPEPRRWADLGSGAGLPGLVLAVELAGRDGAQVDLVESSNKKAAFLREAARELGLPVAVHAARIEASGAVLERAEAVSARALGSLAELLALVSPHIGASTPCYFPKGRGLDAEVAQASAHWRFDMVRHPSAAGDGSAILEIRNAERR